MSISYVLIGFTYSLWQIFALFAIIGAGLGTFMGAFVNLPSIYIARFYPKGIATARACTMNWFFAGMMAGAMVASSLYTEQGKKTAWIVVGCCPLLGAAILSLITAPLINDRLEALQGEKTPNYLEATQHRLEILQKSKGEDPHIFLKKLSDDLRFKLEDRNYILWHGNMQRLVQQCIDDALPELRVWNDKEVNEKGEAVPGFSFLQDVASLHVAHENYQIVADMEERFHYDLHSHLSGLDSFYNHHIHVDWTAYEDFRSDFKSGQHSAAANNAMRNRMMSANH